MQITLIGIILLPLSAAVAVFAPRGIAYLLIVFNAFSATAVMNVTSVTFGVQPYHLFAAILGLLFVFGVFAIPRTGHSAAIAMLLTGFFVAILLSILSRTIRGEIAVANFTQTAIAAVGLATTAMVAYYFSTWERLLCGLKVFVLSALFVSGWGIYQSVAGSLGLSYPDWLFNNSISESADLFAQDIEGLRRISSVAVEPSFFARYTVAAAGVALAMSEISSGRGRAGYLAAAAVIVLAAVLSTSTSAYVGLMLLLALWIARDIRRLYLVFGVGMGAAVLLALFEPQLLAAAWEVTGDKGASGSFYERFASVVVALRRFSEHPLFGHGWEELASYDLFAALLYHVGIVGWLTFFALMAYALLGPIRQTYGAASDPKFAALSSLSVGLRIVLVCVLGVDAVSGISYVAANMWIVLGLVLATQGLERQGEFQQSSRAERGQQLIPA